MKGLFERYVVPALVVQAVMVGGGYASGRELVEFFLSHGAATGLAGMAWTALLFSAGGMVAFELARRYHAFDYRSFCRVYLGRFWFLFEIGYFASLVLVLSIVSAAAARLLAETFGTPEPLNLVGFMVLVAGLVLFGNRFVERIISLWSLLFYATYGALFVVVVSRHGGALGEALVSVPLDPATAVVEGTSYTGYNIAVLPILIFVARGFSSRREALVAGALTGPLVLLPGLAFLLGALQAPVLSAFVKLVIFGAMVKTGAGLLHGLNERIARSQEDRGRTMRPVARAAVAFAATALSVWVAARIGLVDLIAHGYRYSSAYFLLVFLLPLLTRGTWLLWRGRSASPTRATAEAPP